MSAKFKRCPKCGETKELSLIEIHSESGATDYGRIFIDNHGNLVPPSKFWFAEGEPISVHIQCGNCEHVWTPKAKGGASVSSDDISEYQETTDD